MLQVPCHQRSLFHDLETMFRGSAQNDNFWIFEGQEAELSQQPKSAEPEETVAVTDHKRDGESMDGVNKRA